MANSNPRFECVPEPTGTWMVRDNSTREVATLAGSALSGKERQRAEAACRVLTNIYRNRLDLLPFSRTPS